MSTVFVFFMPLLEAAAVCDSKLDSDSIPIQPGIHGLHRPKPRWSGLLARRSRPVIKQLSLILSPCLGLGPK